MAKFFNPLYSWPTEKTGLFQGIEREGRITKDIRDADPSTYGGWWPSFFPTAIAFLVTGDRHRRNIMSSSCIVVMCAHPFTIGMPIFTGAHSPRGSGPRYSFELLRGSGQFTMNLGYISNDMTQKTIICGTLSGRDGTDKFAKAGFTPIPSLHVFPPLLRECPLNLECEVHSMTELGSHTWVIGRVLAVHVSPALASGRERFLWRSMPELFKQPDEQVK